MNLKSDFDDRTQGKKRYWRSVKMEYDVLFEDVKIWEKITPDYYTKTYPISMSKACKFYKVLIRSTVSKFVDLILRFDKRDVIFLYPVERFYNFADIVHVDYNLFTFSNIFSKDLNEKYSNIKVLSNNSIQKGIFCSYKTHDMKYAERSLKKLKDILKRNNVKLIILGNDWTFFERLCAIAGKETGIPVATLQHGIYHKNTINIMEFGKYSDEFWCWSDYVKDHYLERYRKKEDFVKVVGYPHRLVKDYTFLNSKRVLFISTPYTEENKALCAEYERVIETVIQSCSELGLDFSFRPHPREKRDYYTERFKDVIGFKLSEERDMTKDIINSGLVIGDTSSALSEANLLHRRVIQIIWNKDIDVLACDEMYNSMIKTSSKYDDICNAIKGNVGQYYEQREIYYFTGDPKVFPERIMNNIKAIISH